MITDKNRTAKKLSQVAKRGGDISSETVDASIKFRFRLHWCHDVFLTDNFPCDQKPCSNKPIQSFPHSDNNNLILKNQLVGRA